MLNNYSLIPIKNYRQGLLLTFLDACRAHLLLSEFTGKAYGTEVSTTSVWILDKLRSDPNISITEMALELKVNKSSVSRAISNLVENQFLKETSTNTRKKTFLIIKKGLQMLRTHDGYNFDQVERLSANLTKKQVKAFSAYFARLSNEAGIPADRSREISITDRIIIDIRKFSKRINLTSNLFGSPYSDTDWAYLSEIFYHGSTATELSKALKSPNSSVIQKLNSYKKSGLIKYSKNKQDLRAHDIFLTEKGKSVLSKIELASLKLFKDIFADFTDQEIEQLNNLMIKYVGKFSLPRVKKIKDILILPINNSDKDINLLRYFLTKNITKDYPLSGSLFNSENLNFKFINQNGRLFGGLEINQNNSNQVLNYICKIDLDKSLIINSINSFIEADLINKASLRNF